MVHTRNPTEFYHKSSIFFLSKDPAGPYVKQLWPSLTTLCRKPELIRNSENLATGASLFGFMVLEMKGTYTMDIFLYLLCFNPFTNTPFWESPKFKEAADDNWNVAFKGFEDRYCIENILEKGEIAHFEQFHLFPQYFPKPFFFNVFKWLQMEERAIKHFPKEHVDDSSKSNALKQNS